MAAAAKVRQKERKAREEAEAKAAAARAAARAAAMREAAAKAAVRAKAEAKAEAEAPEVATRQRALTGEDIMLPSRTSFHGRPAVASITLTIDGKPFARRASVRDAAAEWDGAARAAAIRVAAERAKAPLLNGLEAGASTPCPVPPGFEMLPRLPSFERANSLSNSLLQLTPDVATMSPSAGAALSTPSSRSSARSSGPLSPGPSFPREMHIDWGRARGDTSRSKSVRDMVAVLSTDMGVGATTAGATTGEGGEPTGQGMEPPPPPQRRSACPAKLGPRPLC